VNSAVRAVAALVIWTGISVVRGQGFDAKAYLAELRESDAREVSVLIVDPQITHLLSFGYDSLLADIYYLKSIQYFGDAKYQGICFEQLPDLLQAAVTFDPKYSSAYRFAADSIPCNNGKGWVGAERARDILIEGTQVYPDDWNLRLRLGYVYLSLLQQYSLAAEQFADGAKQPGAPAYFGPLAARLLAAQGELQGAILVTEHLLQETQNDHARALLEQRLRELQVQLDLKTLSEAIAAFKAKEGRPPSSLDELTSAGLISGVPLDPWQVAYGYDPVKGEVTSTHPTSRFVVYDDH